MIEPAPLAKGDHVTIRHEDPLYFGQRAVVRKIKWKPYPSGRKTPGWWATVDLLSPPPGLKLVRAEVHESHLVSG